MCDFFLLCGLCVLLCECYCNLSHICSRPIYDAYMHVVVLAVVAVVEGVIATYKIMLPCGDFFLLCPLWCFAEVSSCV